MKENHLHCRSTKMAVVLEIPVAARISMLENLECTDNRPFRTNEARQSGKGKNTYSLQRKMSLPTGWSCPSGKLKSSTPKPESESKIKSGRSTTFISKTKYHLVKMTGEQELLVEDLYPKFRSKSSENMESEDSSSQGSGICDKRLSLLSGLSHSDYETCGSQTSLDDYENDRLSISSGLNKEDNISSSLNKLSQDGRTSRPISSVLGDSEIDDLDYSEIDDHSKSEECQGGQKPKAERPACLDQGMTATIAWIRNELSEFRAQDQSLMRQFMEIQGKIRNLKVQQQQRQKQNLMMRKQKQQAKQLLSGDNSSDLLGNHRFSWELDSLYEEDEYYDYDTEDDLDDDENLPTSGASGYS